MCCRLQDEHSALQKELKSTIEESRLVQEKYTKLLEEARSQLAAKIAENEQLRTQVPDKFLDCRCNVCYSVSRVIMSVYRCFLLCHFFICTCCRNCSNN